MSDWDNIVNNVNKLDQWAILRYTLDTTPVKLFIAELNTDNQLGLGLDSTGEVFGLYKSFSYSSFKQGLPGRNAPFGVVDLRLTGDYWDSFSVKIETNGDIDIDSDPVKGERNLIRIYGSGIEGLSDDSIRLLIENIIDEYAENTIKAILK